MGEADQRVHSSYGDRAEEYIELIGHMGAMADQDVATITQWARSVTGAVLDAGCGPGHWTNHLAGRGVDIHGIDLTPAFVAHARDSYPGVRFDVGDITALPHGDGTLGGILAWYSLIHVPPHELLPALAELARCVRPGGRLLLGFFEGGAVAPFDHSVTTAWSWPVDQLSRHLEAAGFVVDRCRTRPLAVDRSHGEICASRPV